MMYRMNILAYIMNIQVPHEVKSKCALANRTSQRMKNGQVVNIQIRSGTRCSR